MADESIPRGDGSTQQTPPEEAVRAAVRGTCLRLYSTESDFVASFRASLLHLVPELRNTTADQGSAVAESLARAILWAALTTERSEVIEETFRNVGAEHGRRGFPINGYHGAGHALLRAARNAQIGEWSSELSSAWVAYYSWLAAHLTEGAHRALPTGPSLTGPPPFPSLNAAATPATFPQPEPPPTRPRQVVELGTPNRDLPAGTAGSSSAVTGGPSSLDEVLELLRARYFTGNEQALGAIVTRVALRTGADLRAPRPDQRINPAVIANVIAVLHVMGYVLRPDHGDPRGRNDRTSSPEQLRTWWWHRRQPSSDGTVRGEPSGRTG